MIKLYLVAHWMTASKTLARMSVWQGVELVKNMYFLRLREEAPQHLEHESNLVFYCEFTVIFP